MQKITRTLPVLILLVCSITTYSQTTKMSIEADKLCDSLVKDLSIQEIRNAVYGVPAYNIGQEMLKGNIPVMRDSIAMKRTATTPSLYIDSLIYENILDAPLLDYQELLIKRFPFLIMHDIRATEKIIEVMDSLALNKPDITADEYWKILKRDYAEVISWNFKRLFDTNKYVHSEKYPFRTIRDIRAFRVVVIGLSNMPMQKNIPIEAKPYLERLGTQPTDSLYFVIPVRKVY